MYMMLVATEVCSRMPCASMAGVSWASPLPLTRITWSKVSEVIPDAS
jgi:hypothetical protein